MKSLSLAEAKAQLADLCEAALRGKPTIIDQDGRLLILQAYSPDRSDPRAVGYFAECYADAEEVERENRCARACD